MELFLNLSSQIKTPSSIVYPGACFSKVPKPLGSLSGVTVPFISSQRRRSKPSKLPILLTFLTLKTW